MLLCSVEHHALHSGMTAVVEDVPVYPRLRSYVWVLEPEYQSCLSPGFPEKKTANPQAGSGALGFVAAESSLPCAL